MNLDTPTFGASARFPLEHVTDFARIQARLAEPFADASWIFRITQTSSEMLEAAQRQWAPRLASDDGLASAYAAAFSEERDRIRSAFTEQAMLDETVLAIPRPALGRQQPPPPSSPNALPFLQGSSPPPPVAPPARDVDAGATLLPTSSQHEATLPFMVSPLKKRT